MAGEKLKVIRYFLRLIEKGTQDLDEPSVINVSQAILKRPEGSPERDGGIRRNHLYVSSESRDLPPLAAR